LARLQTLETTKAEFIVNTGEAAMFFGSKAWAWISGGYWESSAP
jgi:hypothetical protein